MNDTMAAETPMSDHVARFWQHLETETVRILVDLRREVGHDAPDGPSVYWDGATFGDDVAKALVADRKNIERLEATVTAWREVFNSIEAHLQDRINMRDPASPETYLAIIRGEVERVNRSSDAIVNARWADRARDTAEVERLQKHIEELNAKMTCMCGSEINHSAWEGHSPVSMFDHAVEQEVERRIRAMPLQDHGWQDISTAPKDGSYVWVSDGFAKRIAFWADGKQYEHRGSIGGGWRDLCRAEHGGASDLMFAPVYWLRLPASPRPMVAEQGTKS